MSIDCDQLKALIIKPVLNALDIWSESAQNLLLGTCAQESLLGSYISQFPKGPALGIYQMEEATYYDICDRYLGYKSDLMIKVCLASHVRLKDGLPSHKRLIYDLNYATIFCRLHYLRVPEKLPDADDIEGLAAYWKKYYNTEKGKGKEKDFIRNYKEYCM